MHLRHIDLPVLIVLFLGIVLIVPLGVVHLVRRIARFRIDMPD